MGLFMFNAAHGLGQEGKETLEGSRNKELKPAAAREALGHVGFLWQQPGVKGPWAQEEETLCPHAG